MRTTVALIAVLLLAGCGSEDTATNAPASPPPLTTQERPAESPAEEYALEKSGGERAGCSQAAPGAEAAQTPGCIYTAALQGCAAAREGEPDPSKGTPREGDFTEPELRAVTARAYQDCS